MSGASGLRPHDHSSLGQGGSIAGGTGPFEFSGGKWVFSPGVARVYDQGAAAWIELNGYVILTADDNQSITLQPNNGNDNGGATVRQEGGDGLVLMRLAADPAGGDSERGQIYYNTASEKFRGYSISAGWHDIEAAPTTADYLVGTSQAGLSAEIVVGSTPGGELGGTWASPTVDATHSGSAHLALGTTPSTQAIGDSAAGGSASTASKNDHKHAITNPLTTAGDLWVGGVSGAPTRLAKGSDSQVLTVDPTTHLLVWANAASGFADPMTTRGDIIIRDAANATARLGIGSNGKVLQSDGTDISWQTPSSGFPTTAYQAATGDTTLTGGAAATDVTGASISLAAGTWWIDGYMVVTQASAQAGYLRLTITTNANTIVGDGRGAESNLASANAVGVFASCQVTPGSTTTYKLRAEADDNSTVVQQDAGVNVTWMRAIRIA